eukprot:3526143-Pleurochrysis_carterae.AAC.1
MACRTLVSACVDARRSRPELCRALDASCCKQALVVAAGTIAAAVIPLVDEREELQATKVEATAAAMIVKGDAAGMSSEQLRQMTTGADTVKVQAERAFVTSKNAKVVAIANTETTAEA